MNDVPFVVIRQATAVLRAIAKEHRIGLRFGAMARSHERLGEEPTTMACLSRHRGRLTAWTLGTDATPSVIEPLMHEMGHAALGYADALDASPEAYRQDREVCRLVIEWSERLPEPLRGIVARGSQETIDHYDAEGL